MTFQPPMSPPPPPGTAGQPPVVDRPARLWPAALGGLVTFGVFGLVGLINQLAFRIDSRQWDPFANIWATAQLVGLVGVVAGGVAAGLALAASSRTVALISALVVGFCSVLLIAGLVDQVSDLIDSPMPGATKIAVTSQILTPIGSLLTALLVAVSSLNARSTG